MSAGRFASIVSAGAVVVVLVALCVLFWSRRPARVDLVVRDVAAAKTRGVEVVLRNGGVKSVGYNLCPAFLGLERLDGERIVRVGGFAPNSLLEDVGGGAVEPSIMCTTELRALVGGGEAVARVVLRHDLAAGAYRVTQRVRDLADPRRYVLVRSDPFLVR